MPGRERVPSFQLPRGTTAERDGSYNLTTVGNIFYNTDTSNVEIRHVDPSNSLDWRDLVVNNKEQIDISGKLVVEDDVSFNAHMSVLDASFQNDVDVEGRLVVTADVSFNAHMSVLDASFQNDVDVGGSVNISDNMSIRGYLGIGTESYSTTPLCPLAVSGYAGEVRQPGNSYPIRRYFHYNDGAGLHTNSGGAQTWGAMSIWAQNHIVSGGYVVSAQGTLQSSDERIKKDIRDLDEDKAMEEIKNLRPIVYKYIDKAVHNDKDIRGFIAQEVEGVIPTAVIDRDDFIPNIYECVKVSDTYTITFEKYETTELKKGDSIRFIGALGVNRHPIITEIIDEKSIKINEDWTSDLCDMQGNRGGDCLFCYGVKINDFKNLNYDTVLTSLVSAVKQMDKRIKELEGGNNPVEKEDVVVTEE